MPSHVYHNMYDMITIGCVFGTYEYVHQIMDNPQKIFGPKHRAVLHDQATVNMIAQIHGPIAGLVAQNHIELDKKYSAVTKASRGFRKEDNWQKDIQTGKKLKRAGRNRCK